MKNKSYSNGQIIAGIKVICLIVIIWILNGILEIIGILNHPIALILRVIYGFCLGFFAFKFAESIARSWNGK